MADYSEHAECGRGSTPYCSSWCPRRPRAIPPSLATMAGVVGVVARPSPHEGAGLPTQSCGGCGSFAAVGLPSAMVSQFHTHWLSCSGVVALAFHPDGSISSVTFRR